MHQQFSIFLIAGSLALLATTAQAQAAFSIGPKMGLNVSTATNVNESFQATTRTGLEAGVVSTIGLTKHLVLQPALMYSQMGYGQHREFTSSNGTTTRATRYELKNRLNFLTLPINLAYTQHVDGQGFQFFAGPYASVLLNGESTYKSIYDGVLVYDETGETPGILTNGRYFSSSNSYDAGVQAGVGYRRGGLLLATDYSLGLKKSSQRAFQVSLAYLVKPKK